MEKLIHDILKNHRMSVSELTNRLGYQSKTSLVRIMNNQVSGRALDTFARRLNTCLKLTQDETDRLTGIMEQLRWQEDYVASREMLGFLRGDRLASSDIFLEDVSDGTQCLMSQRYADAHDIRVTLINCQYVPIYQQLLNVVRSQGAQVEHYMMMRDDFARVIHSINALIPLVFEKGYSGYSCRENDAHSVLGLRAADLMLIKYRDAQDIYCEELLSFDRENHAFLRRQAEPEIIERMFGIRREEFEPIKTVFFENAGLESYVRFCESCAELEHNRCVYKIKPDLGMDLIPADILGAAIDEGGKLTFSQTRDFSEQFREVNRERIRNAYEKRRTSKRLMKRSAMMNFAKTGRLSDHSWSMRPFTPEERVRILELLRENMRSNPYFEVYFLKNDDFLRNEKIGYYEGMGVMIVNGKTDYSPSSNHTEVMIVHAGFMRMFKEYFDRSLTSDHVIPQDEALAFIDQLIDVASNAENASQPL